MQEILLNVESKETRYAVLKNGIMRIAKKEAKRRGEKISFWKNRNMIGQDSNQDLDHGK